MDYLDETEKMTMQGLFKQAFHRIDGMAMYLVCTFFLLFAFYSALSDKFGWTLPLPTWKGFWGALFLVPITFFLYISLDYFSASGKVSRLLNAFFLLGMPFFIAYKLNLIR